MGTSFDLSSLEEICLSLLVNKGEGWGAATTCRQEASARDGQPWQVDGKENEIFSKWEAGWHRTRTSLELLIKTCSASLDSLLYDEY